MPRYIGGTVGELVAVAKVVIGDDSASARHRLRQRQQVPPDRLGQSEKALSGRAVVTGARLQRDDVETHGNEALTDALEGL